MTQPRPASVQVNGDKLRDLRKMRGDKLAAFAEQCGITLQYLSQIERGDRPSVSPTTYVRICTALGIDRHELLAEAVPQ